MALRDRITSLRQLLAASPLPSSMPEPATSVPPTATPPQATTDVVDNPSVLAQHARGRWSDFMSTAATLVNAITGAGMMRDPASFNSWKRARELTDTELRGMGSNALIAQALAKLPNTATRAGWRVDVTDDEVEDKAAIADTIAYYERRLAIARHIARAMARGRQYSEAFVLLGVEDGRGWHEPVDLTAVETVRWAAVIDRRDYIPRDLFSPQSEHFGKVETFEITDINGIFEDGLRYGRGTPSLQHSVMATEQARQGGRLIVHADRVLHFPTPDFQSLLSALQEPLGAYFESMHGIRTAARESSTVVYKVKDWIKKQWSENSLLASQHMQAVDQAKGSLNAWVVDKDHEDVAITSRSLGGLADLANPAMVWLCAALAIPVTEFWGVSPGGFGKGDSERATLQDNAIDYFYATAAPELHNKLHRYVLVAVDGCALPSADVQREIVINDLSPPDEKERSQLRKEAVEDLLRLFEKGVIPREEVRAALGPLADDYFRLELTDLGNVVSKNALVGHVTAALEIVKAAAAGEIPPDAAAALLTATVPSTFNATRVASIIDPIRAWRSSAPAASPGVATPNAAPGDIEDDEATAEDPDGGDDPASLAWSQNPLPDDAAEASEIAKALRVPTVRVTRAHRAGLIEGWNVLGGKPRFSLAQVTEVVLRANGKLPQPEIEGDEEPSLVEDGADVEEESTTLVVVLRAPDSIARQLLYKPEEPSPPHVTVLYVGKLTPAVAWPLIDALRVALLLEQPLDVELDGLAYFDNEKRVAYIEVGAFGLAELHAHLLETASAWGVECKHAGENYTPHMTLAYLPPGEEYVGPIPSGEWSAIEAEIWYGDERIAVPFDVGYAEALATVDAELQDLLIEQSTADESDDKKQARIDEAFAKFRETVNMSASQLAEWAETRWSKLASLSRAPIERNLRLLRKPKTDWTLVDATAAMRTVSFVSRMRKMEQGEPTKIDGREGPSKRDISLKNWAFDPGRK